MFNEHLFKEAFVEIEMLKGFIPLLLYVLKRVRLNKIQIVKRVYHTLILFELMEH